MAAGDKLNACGSLGQNYLVLENAQYASTDPVSDIILPAMQTCNGIGVNSFDLLFDGSTTVPDYLTVSGSKITVDPSKVSGSVSTIVLQHPNFPEFLGFGEEQRLKFAILVGISFPKIEPAPEADYIFLTHRPYELVIPAATDADGDEISYLCAGPYKEPLVGINCTVPPESTNIVLSGEQTRRGVYKIELLVWDQKIVEVPVRYNFNVRINTNSMPPANNE